MSVIDISSRSKVEIEAYLSNFAFRPFEFEGIRCLSMEGFLQALKFEDIATQRYVAGKWGYDAFRFGQQGNSWKNYQVLWWIGDPYDRISIDYLELITRAYDAQFNQNVDFQNALKSTVGSQLRHSMGKSDPCDSVLTEKEYISQLDRLRWRALEGKER